jgi:hypothetical protein
MKTLLLSSCDRAGVCLAKRQERTYDIKCMKEILYEKTVQVLVEKEYNPERSQKIAEWNNADHTGSLMNDMEALYLTEEGSYFILYEGGLHSRFHELPDVSIWFGGSYTCLVTVDEAYEWCLETANYDAIREHLPFYMLSLK